MTRALVIGGGPAGLMAAEILARSGANVTIAEAKPSLGRKFLMAGKSGLNLTKDESLGAALPNYVEAQDWLRPMLEAFGPDQVQEFAGGLGQDIFTGSTQRVFPKAMKASPFLRAWLSRLDDLGVERKTRLRWIGWDDAAHVFETSNGPLHLTADATVFSMGGASWARLGSDGAWADVFDDEGIDLTPFAPANAAVLINWSDHMHAHFGTPLKSIALKAGSSLSRGEAIVSARGLEGGGVYAISRDVRLGKPLTLDLRPDWSTQRIAAALNKPRGKASFSNHLRKSLKLAKHEIALLREWANPLVDEPEALAQAIKALPVAHEGLRPMDEAISTAGGVAQTALDDSLMLRTKPGHFCAGEMLDWEAPTGGYLLTGCFATGRWAGQGAARYLGLA